MLILLLDCGIRINELATIKLANIDFENASIVINGKGGKVRTVYISETSLQYLSVYRQFMNGEYLFPSTRADAVCEHRGRRYFQRRLSDLYDRANIDRITPHQLRHYFATHALSNGADVKAVSQFLGHADVTITLKIYHHVTPKAVREVINGKVNVRWELDPDEAPIVREIYRLATDDFIETEGSSWSLEINFLL